MAARRVFQANRRFERGTARSVLLGAAVGALSACAPAPSHSSAGSRPAANGEIPPRPVALIVSGDTAGWIMPCGCTANQSGGLPRRGTFVKRARADRAVVLLDAGGAPNGKSLYERLKFEAILAGERAMGIVAHNLGAGEAALGEEYLREVQRRLRVPFLSSNLRSASGELIGAASLDVEPSAGGRRIKLVGVISPRLVGGGLKADDPRDAILRAIAGGRPSDVLVVLAYLAETELRELAAGLPEADLVVGGPTGQSIAPVKVGPTMLASATNKGKFLIELKSLACGAPWSGEVVELSPDFPDDPAQIAILDQFHSELGRRDFAADETGLVPAIPPGVPESYRVAGTEACRRCHQSDCALWDQSKHALAWRTLEGRGLQVDPQCQQCHATSYGMPGGFRSIARSVDRTAVGCESCHGPSQAHVNQTTVRTPFPARDQCIICHDAENSPRFAFNDYWNLIRHGPSPVQANQRRRENRP